MIPHAFLESDLSIWGTPQGLYGVHATQITKWKKQALDSLSEIFSNKQERRSQEEHENTEELYRQIGKQKVEIEFLKKKVGYFER